jgi:hypothetical protein
MFVKTPLDNSDIVSTKRRDEHKLPLFQFESTVVDEPN